MGATRNPRARSDCRPAGSPSLRRGRHLPTRPGRAQPRMSRRRVRRKSGASALLSRRSVPRRAATPAANATRREETTASRPWCRGPSRRLRLEPESKSSGPTSTSPAPRLCDANEAQSLEQGGKASADRIWATLGACREPSICQFAASWDQPDGVFRRVMGPPLLQAEGTTRGGGVRRFSQPHGTSRFAGGRDQRSRSPGRVRSRATGK